MAMTQRQRTTWPWPCNCTRLQALAVLVTMLVVIVASSTMHSLDTVIGSMFYEVAPAVSRARALRQVVERLRARQSCIVVFAADFHPALVQDLSWLAKHALPVCVRVLHHDLSKYCYFFGTCDTSLKVIGRNATGEVNGVNGTYSGDVIWRSDDLIRQFNAAYNAPAVARHGPPKSIAWPARDSRCVSTSEPKMAADIDVFYCTHPVGQCEYFAGFQRKTILHIPVPFWFASNTRLERTAALLRPGPDTIVLANNLFHAKQTRFVTGGRVDPLFVPNFCGYVTEQGVSATTVFGTGGMWGWTATGSHARTDNRSSADRSALGTTVCTRSNLANVPAFVRAMSVPAGSFSLVPMLVRTAAEAARCDFLFVDPYTVSLMTGFEWRRLAVPMVVPSVRFMCTGDVRTKLLAPQNLVGGLCGPFPNPNCRNAQWDDVAQCEEWLGASDWHNIPHSLKYDSYEHAASLIARHRSRRAEIVTRIQQENRVELLRSVQRWVQVFARLYGVGVPTSFTAVPEGTTPEVVLSELRALHSLRSNLSLNCGVADVAV